MSKYKVGDKVVMEIGKYEGFYGISDNSNSDITFWFRDDHLDRCAEPLSTYTEPLEAKIRRQAAEITRLLAENKRLKAENGNVIWEIEQAFDRGCNAAWKLARKIFSMEIKDIEDIFIETGAWNLGTVLENYIYPEAAAKVEAWEKAKEEIKVGDIFQDNDGNNAIVTSIKGNTVYYMWDDGDTRSGFAEDVKKHFTKTGRHIDIDSFLKQIGEEQK